ncbi:MAG: glycosyltransferase [Phycisphaerae bacterium]|nr:glycosyltransferase [Phycisphaerae bacterium]
MHIAHVLPTLNSEYGGPVSAALGLGEAQRRLGRVLSYWATADDVRTGDPEIRCFRRAWPRRWYRSPDLVRALAAEARSIDVGHIYGIWEHTAAFGAAALYKADVPYILHPTGVFTHAWRFNSIKKRLYMGLLAEKMVNRAACVQAASPLEAESLSRLDLKSPITVIPNGVDVDTFEQVPGRGEAEALWPCLRGRVVVLFLSRISPEKGLDILLASTRQLVDRGCRDVLMVIAGSGQTKYLACVKDMVSRHDLGAHVLFTGMVQGRTKLALYARADVFVLPSYSENYGIVVAEAMAAGVPVLTTTCTPWGVLQQIDAGRQVPPDVGPLGEALLELVRLSADSRASMGRRGRQFILQEHTWDVAARRMATVHRCILKGRAIPECPDPIPQGDLIQAEGQPARAGGGL